MRGLGGPWRSPDRRAVTPGGKGRYPGFDVLQEVHRWDEVTAGVVLARLGPQPALAFFTRDERAVAAPLFDQLLGQHDEPRVPVLAMVDVRLAENETDGWHYADMPPDREAWRATLAALDRDARASYGRGFAVLDSQAQARLVQSVQDLSDGGSWHDWPGEQVWSLWTRYACAAFYSHPWAWNEIGFGGPAYPRGYKNLGLDARERWEMPDRVGRDPVEFGRRVEEARGGGGRK